MNARQHEGECASRLRSPWSFTEKGHLSGRGNCTPHPESQFLLPATPARQALSDTADSAADKAVTNGSPDLQFLFFCA